MAEVSISKQQKASITRAVNLLNKVRQEIQDENPERDINWYLEDSCNLCLLEDQSHDEAGNARQDRVILHKHLDQSSGGGW